MIRIAFDNEEFIQSIGLFEFKGLRDSCWRRFSRLVNAHRLALDPARSQRRPSRFKLQLLLLLFSSHFAFRSERYVGRLVGRSVGLSIGRSVGSVCF